MATSEHEHEELAIDRSGHPPRVRGGPPTFCLSYDPESVGDFGPDNMASENDMAVVSQRTIDRITSQAELNRSYLVLMAAAGVLSAVALLTNSVPVLIGAMIIAPAMGPLALVAFAIVGRKSGLAFRGLGVAAIGIIVSTGFAVLTTWIMNLTNVLPPDANLLDKHLLEERVSPGWWSVAAALAAGIAGTLALAQNKLDTTIGTVAALALVPAAAAGGIAFMSDDPLRGLGGLALLGINVALIIVTGIATLLILRPAEE
jgi:uncharacterized hydrophobic protein (TIGR00271 family)